MILGQKKIFPGARILWVLALLLMLVVFAGGPGVHLGLWSPLDGFILSMRVSFVGGLALAALSLIVIIMIAMNKKRGGMARAILTLLIGLALASPVGYLRLSGHVAPIHDITTDTANPPAFIALVGMRGEGANSLVYEGDKLAALQKGSYPDIGPLLVSDQPEQAFARALYVAGNMGWEITGVDASVMRFEATDHTLWFAFADDVVVTIKATEGGSRIDLRSVSRVGVSDLGANAKRIMAFQKNYVTSR